MSKRLRMGLLACCVVGSLGASCGEEEIATPTGAAGDASAQPGEAGAGQGGGGAAKPGSMDEAGRGGVPSTTQGGAGGEISIELQAGAGGVPAASGGSPDAAGQAGGGGAAGGGAAGGGGEGGAGDLPTGETRLGARCNTTAQCADPRAPGLFCLESDDDILGAGPPSGLCTANCQTHLECEAIVPGAWCIDVLASGTGHCVEECSPGEPDPAERKCHDRDEFACTPMSFADTQDPCLDDSQCFYNELCVGGTCQIVVSACLPACQGENDCEPGFHCDAAFAAGFCVETEQSGKKTGEPCTVTDQEPDECLGFCLEDSPGASTGHCSQICSYGYPCAFDEPSQRYEGSCFYTVPIIRDTTRGDFGYCAHTCDCTAECADPALVCLDADLDTHVFGGEGLCSADGTQVLDQCGAGGAGGGGG
ncbi:MAG TPA: hypothetical protein VJN18_35360 [Polyangiaceae bacterium]|nr:hypothetical protein [Polyangiaceae bacterium]